MITVALLFVFLGGFLLLNAISPKFTYCERIGFAFPIGLALVTFLMLLLDWMGSSITTGSSLSLTFVVFIIGLALQYPHRKQLKDSFKPQFEFKWFNVLWLIMLCLLIYVEYANWEKTIFFPAYDRDSMAGFDTIGYIAAQEHTYKGMSIFQGDYMPRMHMAGSCIAYLPMLQLAYAFIYSLGAETSKIIPALFYLSFIIGFYGMATRTMSHTAAMFCTLGMTFTPEMLSFSSLSTPSALQAGMAATGLMYVCIWQQKNEIRYLYLGVLLLAINDWLRAEGIVFAGAGGVIVLIQCLRKKTPWKTIVLPFLPLIPTILFMLYGSACQLTAESAIITHPYYDVEKAATVWNGAWALLTNNLYYGWAFILALVVCIANMYFTIKKGDNWAVLTTIILSMVLYYIVLYQVDYKWDSINNVLAYSAKRYMFCYVPMVWYFVGNSRVGQLLFNWIENQSGFAKTH